jgi:hypothetical protein
MKERRAVLMIPDDEAFATQATANFLGMSRQTFVRDFTTAANHSIRNYFDRVHSLQL